MGSIKSVIRIILIVAVLLFFQSCGIPQMFRWEQNNEYSISGSAIRFNTSYSSDGTRYDLEPKNGFPRLHFFYAIAPQTGLTSGTAYSLLASSFNSRYSDSVPPTTIDVSRHDPIVTRTVYPTDASSSTTTSSVIGLYEFVNAYDTSSRPDFPDSINDFLDDTESSYDKFITYSAETVSYGSGYAIQLTLNNGRVYTLIRNNGEPFMTDISEYIEEQGSSEVREFDYGDAASYFQMPSIYIYVSCSFACVGYTSVYTIPLTVVGSPIALASL